MNVHVRNEYRVEVGLSSEELEGYGITYEEIDYGNIETRRLLWSLTEEIRQKNGINIKLSGKLLIEVMKDTDNSVTICFSSLPDKSTDAASLKQLIRSSVKPVIAEFQNFEELMCAVNHITSDTEGCLYERNGKYRLLLSANESGEALFLPLLYEFGEVYEASAAEAARCEELWRYITNDAVKNLKGLL